MDNSDAERLEADDEAWGMARKCELCSVVIPAERIEIFPDTRLCVACQQRDERGEDASKPGGKFAETADYCRRCGNIMTLRQSRGTGITRYVMVCPVCRV